MRNCGIKLSWSVNIPHISANHLAAFSAFATQGECNLQLISTNTICIMLGKNYISILNIVEEFQVHQTLQVVGFG